MNRKSDIARTSTPANDAPTSSTETPDGSEQAGALLLDYMLHGLNSTDQGFAAKCGDFFVAAGAKGVQTLRRFSEFRRTRPSARERVREIIGRIQEAHGRGAAQDSASVARIALIDGLRIRSARVNAAAQALLCMLAADGIANDLLLKALIHRKQPGFCARLLETAAMAGGPVDIAHRALLITMQFGGDKRIREQAARLAMRLQGDDIPADAVS